MLVPFFLNDKSVLVWLCAGPNIGHAEARSPFEQKWNVLEPFEIYFVMLIVEGCLFYLDFVQVLCTTAFSY